MKQLEFTPTRSRIAPNMIGSRKPPSPPAIPTMPETAPIRSGKSSPIYLKVDAMPQAKAMPSTNKRAVKSQGGRAIPKLCGPSTVCTINSVFGYESRNRQIHATHRTHQVTAWAPKRSDSQPPNARNTPPGSEKQAASSEACAMEKPYSFLKYCGIQTESAVK